jgi:very-short-patch-repair endonuclease
MKPFSLLDQVLSESERKRMKFVGLKRTLKPRAKFTSLERKYYLMLKNLDVYYVPQYPMGGRFYDAYLPDQNILLEFDGTFWHPKNESDVKYDFQKKAIKVDALKNEMAKKKGMKIIRIREDEPISSEQMKKLIFS